MIEICALASGSNGNCYYIGNEHDAVLVDAGVSTKKILLRMEEAGLQSSKVRGIFISHEHSDHVHGVRVLSKRLGVPAWFTQGTLDSLKFGEQPSLIQIFTPDKAIKIGSLTIHPFLKNHDAAEPCSFRIEHDGWHIGVFTDIGEACARVIHHLHMCHALFIETNYDEKTHSLSTNGLTLEWTSHTVTGRVRSSIASQGTSCSKRARRRRSHTSL